MKSHSQITLIPLFFITLFAMTLTACGASAQDIALHKAVRANDPQAVQQLLEEGADVNAPETAETTALDSKSTPLINAAGKEYLEVVEILIAHGADVNATSIYGTSALGEAAIKGNDEIVTLLLTSGADINTTNKWGKTPLMWAADFGQTSIVQLLLAAGADASLKDEDGLTALDFAQEGDHDEIVALLLADADTTISAPDASSTVPPTAVFQPTPAPFIEFTQLRQQQLPHGIINRAALSPEAGLAAAAFRDGGIGLYDLTTFAETDFVALEDQAASLTFSPDGSQLALGLNGEMRLWSIENGRFQPNPLTISDMGSWVEAVTFSSDGALLAAAIYPKTIRIWYTADNSLVREIDNGQVSKSLAFSPDGQLLAAGDTDGKIQIWDVENGRLQQTLGEPNDELAVHDWGITALAFSPDGTQLAATTPDNFDTIIWDSATGTPLQTIQEDTNFVKGYHFSPDGNTLLTIRGDAKLWDMQSGELLQTLENPGTLLAAGEFIDADKIVTLNVQGLVREWKIP